MSECVQSFCDLCVQCIQLDGGLWFHFKSFCCLLFAAVCRDAVVLSVVFAFVCSVSHVQWCIKIRSPFSAAFRWQSDNAPSQPMHIRIGWNRCDNRTRAIFVYFIFIFRCAIRHSPFAWIVMTKTFGYLKGHMSFWSMPGEIVAIDECAHTLATTC